MAKKVAEPMAAVLDVYRPEDNSPLQRLPMHSVVDVQQVAGRLREEQVQWQALGVDGRTRWILSFRQWLLDNADNLVAISQAEGGKVANEAWLEITLMTEIIDYYARVAPKLMQTTTTRGHSPLLVGKRFRVQRVPFPVVGVIGAWNFPMLLTLGDAISALFAGAAVLLKSSELTPLAVQELVRGWREDVGAPPVLDAVVGGAEVGEALIDAVDYVQFTGSVATGRRVGERAAQAIKPFSLELGGKDPFLVLNGANLKRAANCAVYGAFTNNGQVCMSIERVYVEDGVYDEFVELVVERVRALRSGTDSKSDVGAFTSPAQIEIVERQVREAESLGAKVLVGGNRIDRPGAWFEPTVIVDVRHDMELMREETFGPVLPIVRVSDAEEAIRLANDTHFGLSATVFAGSTKEAQQVADRLEVGAVNINDFLTNMTCAEVPQGGWKSSGIGSRASTYGLQKFTRTRVVSSNQLPTLDTEINWFPYGPRRLKVFRTATRLLHGRGRGRLGL